MHKFAIKTVKYDPTHILSSPTIFHTLNQPPEHTRY